MQKLFVGGIGAVLLSVGLLFAFNKNKDPKIIPRDIILQISKRIRQQMYAVLFDISSFVQQRSSQISPDELRSIILSEEGEFCKSMNEKLRNIYEEYEITQADFEQQCQKVYANDAEIQYHLKQYQQEIEKALLGTQPEFKEDCITFMGKQKVLGIVKEILLAKLERIKLRISQIKTVLTIEQLKKILKNDEQKDARSFRLKTLQKLGLVSEQKEAIKIFQFCVSKYIKFDSEFKEQYDDLLRMYDKDLQQIVKKASGNKIP